MTLNLDQTGKSYNLHQVCGVLAVYITKYQTSYNGGAQSLSNPVAYPITCNQRPFCVDNSRSLCRLSVCPTSGVPASLIEFFNNSDAILNFEHIAMHCGLFRVIQLF